MSIELRRVSVELPNRHGPGTVRILSDVDLTVAAGETRVLIGPSGCGKTTTLKLMNRLLSPSSGSVRVDGADIADADPVALRRRMGYVVQSGGLFPHLTVARNVGILGEIEGWPRPRIHARVRELLALVRMDPDRFARRHPRQLSGGQQQRVGVARALFLDPPYVLMDEPFGALDPITRAQLQDEFRELRAAVKKTVVMVTHDLAEAFLLGDRVAVMNAGRIEQEGTPDAIRRAPRTDFVERFLQGHGAARSLGAPTW